MNFNYSRNYFPPAPSIDVTFITAAEFLQSRPLTALVDSGADATLVPLQHLEEIHAPPTVEMIARSQWGERRRVMLYLVDVRIGDLTLSGIEVIGDEMADEVVLGRDVLNRLYVGLNGPKERVEVTA